MGSAEDEYAVAHQALKIHGWLRPPAALRTVDILRWQEAEGIGGGLVEIGVMCGKYFALLLESAERADAPLLGIDTFQYAPQSRVRKEMKKIFGRRIMGRVTLLESRSCDVPAARIAETVGAPRFVSVDGSHEAPDVLGDLELCEAVLAPDGLVSADDFLNPLTLGVNEAINDFCRTARRLVPVGFVANKLFMCRPGAAARYMAAFEGIMARAQEDHAVKFRERATHGRHHVEQPFHGHRVLVM